MAKKEKKEKKAKGKQSRVVLLRDDRGGNVRNVKCIYTTEASDEEILQHAHIVSILPDKVTGDEVIVEERTEESGDTYQYIEE